MPSVIKPDPIRWCVIRSKHGLRVRMWYASGYVAFLPPCFSERAKLDKFLQRFYPGVPEFIPEAPKAADLQSGALS